MQQESNTWEAEKLGYLGCSDHTRRLIRAKMALLGYPHRTFSWHMSKETPAPDFKTFYLQAKAQVLEEQLAKMKGKPEAKPETATI